MALASIRNHELSAGESTQAFVEGGMYNLNEFGGTTNLIFDPVNGRFEQCYTSLGRTIRNCAGGPILRAPPAAPLASAVTALAHIP